MSLEAREVSLRKGGRILLDGVSATLGTGCFHAIIGPNGAGKSLLLRCLAGWERPETGFVMLDGDPVCAQAPAALARKRAVVGQESEPAFDFNAAAIVALGRTSDPRLGFGAFTAGPELAALRRVGLEAKAGQAFATLSGGEKQRVHLARALLQLDLVCTDGGDRPRTAPLPSRWLLVDEPTNALDLHQQQAILRLLRDLSRQGGVGVCAILHDLNLAAAYADQIWALREGRLFSKGETGQVLTPETLGSLFDLHVHRRLPEGIWPECFQATPTDKGG